MKEKTKQKVKKNLIAAADMAMDLAVKSVDLLDPSIWVTPHLALMQIANIGRTFVSERLKSLVDEIREKISNGSIDKDALASEENKYQFFDLAKFIAQENPDPEIWNATKKIFISTLQKDTSESEKASLYELIDICKALKATEIKILAGSYSIYTERVSGGTTSSERQVNNWAAEVSKRIGLQTSEEVLRYEKDLMEQRLIAPREVLRGDVHETWVGIPKNFGHRLTPLGLRLAESLNSAQ